MKHLLESGRIDFPRSGRALVPGCGRVRTDSDNAPDVALTGLPNRDTMRSLSLKRSAWRHWARIFLPLLLKQLASKPSYTYPSSILLTNSVHGNAQSTTSAAKVQFELMDFFKMEEEDAFSLIYDYTCVHSRTDPSLRFDQHECTGSSSPYRPPGEPNGDSKCGSSSSQAVI